MRVRAGRRASATWTAAVMSLAFAATAGTGEDAAADTRSPVASPHVHTAAAATTPPARTSLVVHHELPLGGTTIFPRYHLVAYYGTPGTAALGVLGEGTIPRMTQRLRAAARPYRTSGRPVQIVYELIASIADAHPGPDGTYSHVIDRTKIERFIHAARRNKALLVLDLQPGRQSFLTLANRFRWALQKPFVGLALDPEWRMGPRQVPAREVGHVRAAEVNRVSRMVAAVVRNNHLPEKVFMVHQFRREMIRDIDAVRDRPGLAMVQHVDGFGTRGQKLATYHHVSEPARFRMGFKLFYDEDTDLFRPGETLRIRPRISFVSYQ